jgi:hypothetical protein
MKGNFKFNLCIETYPEHKHRDFNATLRGVRYNVTWKGDKQGIDYSKKEVERNIKKGVWIVI